MSNLRNIIFDLGGVLLNIDYQQTKSAFEALGFNEFDLMYSQYSADQLFADLETGRIEPEAFYQKLLGRNPNISRDEITLAWNKMLLNFRVPSLAFLEELAKKYNLYLLSNTNAIHLAAFKELFTRETGEASLDPFFTKAWYSHLINLRKPNDDIFAFILKDGNIKAEESLFIDDSFNNIETAARLGFRTHLLKPGETIEGLAYE
ncbi:MAG: hydrolase [Ferruginibacter sp.]|nr:hydrolase [Ferruginibacter sp.]